MNLNEENLFNVEAINAINVDIENYLYPNKTTEKTLESYLSTSCIDEGENFNLLQYFIDHYLGPLSRFAVDLASVPGSSSAVERLFSQASLVCTKERMRLANKKK